MIACCGMACTECPGFLATQNDDDQLRAKTAAEWSNIYQAELKPEDINCDGCLSDGPRLIGHASVCAVRKCGREKGIENCASCDDYSCSELDTIHGFAPEAKKVLDEIRAGRQG